MNDAARAIRVHLSDHVPDVAYLQVKEVRTLLKDPFEFTVEALTVMELEESARFGSPRPSVMDLIKRAKRKVRSMEG